MANRLESLRTIVGPCAAESAEQVLVSGKEAQQRGIGIVRSSLVKPRTHPGWDGVGIETGAPWLEESAKVNGIIPATEVRDGGDVKELLSIVKQPIVVWVGSRNQNHWNQQSIGRAIKDRPDIMIGVKNPMAEDLDHWLGVVDHLVYGGADKSQIFLIHRGFKPASEGFRNTPNWELMKQAQEISGLPMVVDTSHMAGERNRVILITREIIERHVEHNIDFDGLMIEVHPDPAQAFTDASQQISWLDYDRYLNEMINHWSLSLVDPNK
jgi:chorismate mutase